TPPSARGSAGCCPTRGPRTPLPSFEDTTADSVSLIRCDDPPAAIGEGRIDVALIRGEIADPRDVRVVHPFDETRIAACSARYHPKRFHRGRTPGSVTPVPVRPAHSRSFAAGDTFLPAPRVGPRRDRPVPYPRGLRDREVRGDLA